MDSEKHYEKLANMYLAAPINALYEPEITITEGACTISMPAKEAFFHAAGALHGSAYFKLLDDTAFFAASSYVYDNFLITSQFNIYLLRPVAGGIVYAKGVVLSRTRTQIVAESKMYDSNDKLVAHGSGTFMRSRLAIAKQRGYGLE